MKLSVNDLRILAKARRVYGPKAQIAVSAEECCELAKELLKALRYEDFNSAVEETRKEVISEVADVFIILDHVVTLYNMGEDEVKKQIRKKIARLERWMENTNSFEYTTKERAL